MRWNIMLTSREYLVNLTTSFGNKLALLVARLSGLSAENRAVGNICSVVLSSAEVDAQMVELVVDSKIQRSVSRFSTSGKHLLFRTYKLPLATTSVSMILRGLLPVHCGHLQIFHFEVSRLLRISFLRVRVTFAIQGISILLANPRKGWRALNILVKLRFLLLLLIFHCLYSLDLLFPVVNDDDHLRARLIRLHDFLRISFFALNTQLIRSSFDR